MALTDNSTSSEKHHATAAMEPTELQRLELFQRVSIHAVWGLLERCPLVVLRPGDTLFEAGRITHTLYFVLEGLLSMRMENSEGTVVVGTVKSGQTVGELSMLDDQPSPVSVVAEQHSRLLALDQATFWRLVEAAHEFAVNLLLLLSERLRSSPSPLVTTIKERRRFEHESRIDNLTGLHNCRWFDEMLPRLVERHNRDGRPLSVALIDIDEFKKYNDTYGHTVGDRVLTVLARVMAENLRPTDLAARYGGEEFALLLPNVDIGGANTALERLRGAVSHTPIRLPGGGELPPVTISVGVTQLRHGQESSAVIEEADAALMAAKCTGRNRVMIAAQTG